MDGIVTYMILTMDTYLMLNCWHLHNRCIPYRLIEDSDEVNEQCDIENKIEVLMVSSPNRDDLVFPKVYNFAHSWLKVLA